MVFKYIEPSTLLKLNNIYIRAKYVVDGFISGIHCSPYYGHSLDFVQHREYSPGDELKHIDWKIYGRTDKYFIKQYQEETNLRAYILLDISKSMIYKSEIDSIDKLTYGIHLSAILAYMLLHQDDSVGLVTFDNEIKKVVPSKSQLNHFNNIVEVLESLQHGNDTNISNIAYSFSKYLKRRGLIILISDLFDNPTELLKTMKILRYKHHDVIVFQIITRTEKEFLFEGTTIFEDIEDSNTKIKCEPNIIKQEYQKLFERFINEYKIGFRQSEIDYCLLTTDTPFEIGLGTFLNIRNKQ